MYLAWFDATDPRKKPPATKIAEGCARYRQKFGREPEVCLCNPADATAVEGLEVRPVARVGKHCFWIGRDE